MGPGQRRIQAFLGPQCLGAVTDGHGAGPGWSAGGGLFGSLRGVS